MILAGYAGIHRRGKYGIAHAASCSGLGAVPRKLIFIISKEIIMKTFIAFFHFTKDTEALSTLPAWVQKSSRDKIRTFVLTKAGGAFALTADRSAHQLWGDLMTPAPKGVSRLTVVQVGPDWSAQRDTLEAGWLNNHLGPPPWQP